MSETKQQHWTALETRGLIKIAPAVRSALTEGRAVVALESTIISHGMPYPQNFDTAVAVEDVATANGAVPATIAILDGVICIGLVEAQLKRLALLGHKCRKCSRRDLAYVLANKLNGATTVAATMYCASLVGIQVFVTGGIGGVHRGVERTMDVSADLTELSRTPVAVICAGVKSILDIRRTLEYLETQGVPVTSYGQQRFPAFFTPDSGFDAAIQVDSPTEYARMIRASKEVGLTSGMVLGVPVPPEKAAALAVIEEATVQALEEADAQHISGKNITPFLLQRINELTGGKSLKANIALIKNNCRIGSQIAQSLAALNLAAAASSTSSTQGSPVVVGGTNVDLLGKPVPGGLLLQKTSNMGVLSRTWGGVGRNIAEGLARLDCLPFLVTAVGQDTDGKNFPEHCASVGIRDQHSFVSPQHNTSTYLALFDEKGDHVTSIAAMQATTYLTGERIQQALTNIQTQQAAEGKNVPIVVLDGNLEPSCITQAFAYCAQRQIPAWYEPTSFVKSTRVWPSWQQGAVQFLSPSDDELVVMHEFIKKQDSLDVKATLARYSAGISEHTLKSMCKAVLRDIGRDVHTTHHIIVTRAAQGVCIASYVPSKALFEFTSLPAIPARQVVNASGAGDSFVAGTVYALLKLLPSTETLLNVSHTAVVAAVRTGGLPAGTLTVESAQSVTSLTPQALAKCRQRRPTASKLTSNL